jgi:osmotically-inducible protein OsmY
MKNRYWPLAAALAATTLMSACAPLLLGGAAVGSALMYVDRRTAGTQVDDESIEIKASKRLHDALGEQAHLNVTSYNRIALVTGEVTTEEQRAQVERTVSGVDNVRSVVNEAAVAPLSSFGARSSDAIVTSKVKASLIDAKDLQAQAIKVVTERGIVYLMGRVTEREADRSVEVARGVGGVKKVVRVFEIITEDELKAIGQPRRSSAG